ncbi:MULTISPECIES: hypothetical protein [Flavobacterium]|uniref:hypothetical protein n=1 Tax=Flavobacterium TaxID=237 RepID=UPI001FCBDDD4|nr:MULTISPECIES: hypothetical protein [Flavobacterium]UOK41768.1 hypothetical protein LZF87_10650 [Flavobacterium enshiense]
MKKKILLLLTLLSMSLGYSQVSVSKKAGEKEKETENTLFKTFKNTTTVFVLSNLYEKSQYEKILKESWTVTPFEVVMPHEFNIKNYLNGNYSFAHLNGSVTEMKNVFLLKCQIEFFLPDLNKIQSKYKPEKHDDHDLYKLLSNSKLNIASISVSPNGELLGKVNGNFLGNRHDVFNLNTGRPYHITMYEYDKIFSKSKAEEDKKVEDYIYEEKVFTNYNLGMLKNYLQKVNQKISNEEPYSDNENEISAELKNLKNGVLYLPEALKIKYNPRKYKDENWKEGELEEILGLYKYKYEFISEEELDKKILANESIYYLRYAKVNSHKYINVVNGQSGEIIYRFHDSGFSQFNIKDEDFENLSKAIL